MKRLAMTLIAIIGLTGCINKPQVEFIQVTEAERITVTEAQTETELESVELTIESETESNTETEIAAEAHRIAVNEFLETERVNYQPETENANLGQNLTHTGISNNVRSEAAANDRQITKVPETEDLPIFMPQTEATWQIKEYTPPVTDEASEAVYAAPIVDEYSEEVNHDEAAADASRAEVSDTWEYCGNYRITAYMWTGNPMANGQYPDLGWCATGEEFPFGTVLYIDGYGYYTVGDRGVYNGQVDLYMHTYEACMTVGLQYRDVWRVK